VRTVRWGVRLCVQEGRTREAVLHHLCNDVIKLTQITISTQVVYVRTVRWGVRLCVQE
jgi:hypothetical protein